MRVEPFAGTAQLAALTEILGRRKYDSKIAASNLTVAPIVNRYAALTSLIRPAATLRIAPDPHDDVAVRTAVGAKASTAGWPDPTT
jgi:hypothetical protein